MQYSNYQIAIFNAIENSRNNLAINAVAGSGKTTTIVEACKRLHLSEKDVKFLAFNKSIADELSYKLRGLADVGTLHKFGFAVLRRIFKGIKVDERKWNVYLKENVYTLSDEVTVDTQMSDVYTFIANTLKIFNLCRINLVQHGDMGTISNIADSYGIETYFDEVSVANKLLANAYTMPSDMVIDFTDMIVLPLSYRNRIWHYKYVFVDECQDLSTAQRELMLEAAKGGRFVAVGDRNQAINGFCGADCESFDKIANLPNTKELPLSVNYRCGSDIVALAKQIVPQIEAHDGAIEGEIKQTNKLTRSLFTPNTMVVCRCSAPLVGMCCKLLQNGITAVVKGKDIAQSLKSLIDAAKTNRIDSLMNYLAKQQEKVLKSVMRERAMTQKEAEESPRYVTICDKCKCIENLLCCVKSVAELKTFIDSLFTEENVKNAVTFSTVHKSKGLEADKVVVLLPHKLPLVWKGQKAWQYQQERNLQYVAYTRAKKVLTFVNLEEADLIAANVEND